jgi:acyl carrier protein
MTASLRVQSTLARIEPTTTREPEPALTVWSAVQRCGLRLDGDGVEHTLDLTRFTLAWSEVRSLCAVQTSLLELAAEAVADANFSCDADPRRIAIVASHTQTLDEPGTRGSVLRARTQSMARLLARTLELRGPTLDVAAGRDAVPAMLQTVEMLLDGGLADYVLVALSMGQAPLNGSEARALAACFVFGRSATVRGRGRVERGASLDSLLQLARASEAPPRELTEQLVPSATGQKHALIAAVHATHDRSERLAFVSDELIRRLRAFVSNQDAGSLHAHTPMTSLGLDSLAVVELKRQLEAELHIVVSLKTLIGCEQLSDVAKLLLSSIEAVYEPCPATTTRSLADSAASRELLARLDQLSERELDELLSIGREAST